MDLGSAGSLRTKEITAGSNCCNHRPPSGDVFWVESVLGNASIARGLTGTASHPSSSGVQEPQNFQDLHAPRRLFQSYLQRGSVEAEAAEAPGPLMTNLKARMTLIGLSN